jgi:molybdate/tungstate transport system ATP-binding protein
MIEVIGVHKQLGEFSLNGIDLRVESGEYFVVLGPTGSGKTVLLECIAGLHKLDAGEVHLEGRNVTDLLPEQRNVAYVPQDYVLFPHMSLRRNIQFSLEIKGASREVMDQRVAELSELLGISHLLDRHPRTLSGGEQQRGALARALAPSPTLLLLDEPLSALDEGTRGELIAELDTISRETAVTVIHVCHNFDEALELASRIAIIRHGLVVQTGPPAEVFRQPCSEFVARFVGARNLFPVVSADAAGSTVRLSDAVRLRVARVPDLGEMLASIRPEEISIRGAGAAGTDPAANELPCVLARAEDRGRFYRLCLEGEINLIATMTRQAFLATSASPGDAVTASFSPEAVHLLSR